MSKYTIEERREIYTKAYESLALLEFDGDGRIVGHPDHRLGCYAIAEVCGIRHGQVTEDDFPEFFTFRDTQKDIWLGESSDGYASYHRSGNELRQTVMLLCAELCVN
jgi:hypothetical protein